MTDGKETKIEIPAWKVKAMFKTIDEKVLVPVKRGLKSAKDVESIQITLKRKNNFKE